MSISKQQRRDDYATYRARMEHEDTLIGQRMTWLVSSQAFLLTPYVLLFLKPFDVDASSNPHRLPALAVSVITAVLEIVIACVGFRCCYRVGKSLAGGELAMDNLTYIWKQMYAGHEGFEPDISPDRKESVKGFSAPHGLIQSFTKAWSVLTCLSLLSPFLILYPVEACCCSIPVALLGVLVGNKICQIFYGEDRDEVDAAAAHMAELNRGG